MHEDVPLDVALGGGAPALHTVLVARDELAESIPDAYLARVRLSNAPPEQEADFTDRIAEHVLSMVEVDK